MTSTQPSERSSATRSSSQLGVGSSLKRSPGSTASRAWSGSEARRVAEPDRATKLTGSAAGRRRPAARGRSGAARGRAPRSRTPSGGRSGRCSRIGSTGKRLANPSSVENSSNVRAPCSHERSPPPLSSSIWSIWSQVMSSPSPTWPPPISRTTIETFVNPPEVSRTSGTARSARSGVADRRRASTSRGGRSQAGERTSPAVRRACVGSLSAQGS